MKVLHVLSQRPSLTGSGVTLEAFVRHATQNGWEQRVIVGVPSEDPRPDVGGLSPDRIHPLLFDTETLPFPVPGMSDVMPYRSTRFSAMGDGEHALYQTTWRTHIQEVVRHFQPDVIHSHHIWILSSILKDICPDVPVVTSCHATGLRQMRLCPDRADEVRRGCARNDGFLVLHQEHAEALERELEVEGDRVHVVGAGYREELFGLPQVRSARGPTLLYAGKYSHAKGLPWLLDAVERLAERRPGIHLHVAGTGAGSEADALRIRMESMQEIVTLHGQVNQDRLSTLMTQADVFVLPSFYEGLPLVLIEALACGCKLVCTRLTGVVKEFEPVLGEHLRLVPLPRLKGPDVPVEADLPAFVAALERTLTTALDAPPPSELERALVPFRWASVFERVEAQWQALASL